MSDIAGIVDWRRFGGAVNAVALLLFVIGTLAAVVRGKLAAPLRPPGTA